MSKPIFKYALLYLGLLIWPFATLKAYAASVQIIDQGPGFQQLHIPPSQSSTLRSLSGSNKQALNVYTFHSLQGVLTANLPQWLVDEIFLEYGYDDWRSVTSEQLNEPIPAYIVNIDQVEVIEQGLAQRSSRSLCGGKWYRETETQTRNLSKLFDANASGGNSNIFGSLSGALQVDGQAQLSFHYKLRKNRCFFKVPYGFKYEYSDIKVDAQIERSTIHYRGDLNLNYEGDLLKKRIKLIELEHEFWASVVKVEIDSQLNLDLGIEAKASATANVDGAFFIEGNAHIDYRCYLKKCEKINKDVNFRLGQDEQPSLAAELELIARPYANLNIDIDTTVYWKAVDVVQFQLGMVAALPARFYAYAGNTCGDADSDGTREWVDGSLIDVNFESYMYLLTQVVGKKHLTPINLNLSSFARYHRDASEINQRKQVKVYYKNLYFKNIGGIDSELFKPMITTPQLLAAQNSGALISVRPCYPLVGNLQYEVDWGDGEIERFTSTTRGSLVRHDWPYYGDVLIASRIVSDDAGRKFNTNWTYARVNISPDGQTPIYPWLPALINSQLF